MLVELVVENLAVVEHVRVRLHPGLNLLTGETGSGKSIVVDALSLLFGGRASAEMIRSGATKARIAGVFEVPAEMAPALKDSGVECEDGELLIEREILPNGKSRAFAGSRMVTASLLKELAPLLGDIHGQHDQQNLASKDLQREMLDSYAGNGRLLEETGHLFADWRRVSEELDELDRGEQEKLRMADLWTFQRREIESVELKPGEDEQLEAERKIQKNFARLEESANAAYELLYEGHESVSVQLRAAMRKLEDLARIDPSFEGTVEALKPAFIAIDDASHTLRDYLGNLEADPRRLEAIESRLAAIEKLKRKYGASIDEILEFLSSVTAQLTAVESAGERRAALVSERERLGAEYGATTMRLTSARKDAARKLARQLQSELASLALQNAVCEIRITPAEAWTAHGADVVEFLFSANAGEEPKPLDRVASGGELSRIALALRTCTAPAASSSRKSRIAARTLVFDEVDAGIGGSAADAVAKRLKKLAAVDQVLCVTHLAQVASYADHHYFVDKRTERGRTFSTVEELDRSGRTREIGRMLSGEKLTPEALKHAEQLIKAGTAS